MDDRQAQPHKAATARAHVTFFCLSAFLGAGTMAMSGLRPMDAFGWSLGFAALHALSIGFASSQPKEAKCVTPGR